MQLALLINDKESQVGFDITNSQNLKRIRNEMVVVNELQIIF